LSAGISTLAIVLLLDAALSFGFGLVSYLSPGSTYATIVDLSGVHEQSAMSSILGSLSIFYIVIGALCGLAAFMPSPHDVRVAAVMTLQHAWVGLKGVSDMHRPWIVGDPLPDLVIHSLFVVAYAMGITWRARRCGPS